MVDGREWPFSDGQTVWLPAGAHTIEPSQQMGPLVVRLNADLKTARRTSPTAIEFTYQSAARAIAILDREAKAVRIDGEPATPKLAGPHTLFLPHGQHEVVVETK